MSSVALSCVTGGALVCLRGGELVGMTESALVCVTGGALVRVTGGLVCCVTSGALVNLTCGALVYVPVSTCILGLLLAVQAAPTDKLWKSLVPELAQPHEGRTKVLL